VPSIPVVRLNQERRLLEKVTKNDTFRQIPVFAPVAERKPRYKLDLKGNVGAARSNSERSVKPMGGWKMGHTSRIFKLDYNDTSVTLSVAREVLELTCTWYPVCQHA
jgi:hypothetical protein